jgi:hypothetical protein
LRRAGLTRAGLRSALTTAATLSLSEIACARNLWIDARGCVDLLRFGLHCLPVELAVHHLRAKLAELCLRVRMFRESRGDFLALVVRYLRKIESSLPALSAALSL